MTVLSLLLKYKVGSIGETDDAQQIDEKNIEHAISAVIFEIFQFDAEREE